MKKHYFITILLTVLMSMVGTKSFAHDIEYTYYDGVTYYFVWTNNNTELAVSYRGSSCDSYSNEYSGNISIPSDVFLNGKYYTVTSIGDSEFDGCSSLTSVTIPSTVKIIESGAFYKCSGLTSVIIPEGVKTIGLGAFSACSSMISVSIPSSVTSIGKYAFDRCTSLNNIVSKKSQPIAIDNSVFATYDAPHNVYSMATLAVPSGSKNAYQNTSGWNKFSNINDGSSEDPTKRTIHVAFPGTINFYIPEDKKYTIEELIISGEINGNDLAFICEMAGKSCHVGYDGAPKTTDGKLKVLDMSGTKIVAGGCYFLDETGGSYWGDWDICNLYNDNYIPGNMFSGCIQLESIILPNSVISIGNGAFSGCNNLTSITFESGNTNYDSRENCNAIIETNTNTIIASSL